MKKQSHLTNKKINKSELKMTIINLKNVNLTRNKKEILKDITWKVNPGENLGYSGPQRLWKIKSFEIDFSRRMENFWRNHCFKYSIWKWRNS